ncbi:crotonase/enoyl-CoA hydratase family protein [Meiothermus sp. QL-1]|uniref:crotonase/enoyl-CoA hydratase family protein n=1 Tax=Meiothermus sp. QL-1 TaxID=2058095 RepID=UPI000E0CB740|nr:crotonase/enoyl-CoA hydratase family protein [Meiothermus sp. QL-1]RDI94636.1 crotonase/enoyl-CoA hydratase family protein [Meiothermus sp. QL-1]
MGVLFERKGRVCTVILHRPEVRNAVDAETAHALAEAFRRFEADDSLHVAVLWGAGGHFCSGADLKAFAEGRGNLLAADMRQDGPMGPTRMWLSKPVIAAISGYAVAGGLELALWCDIRVVERNAVLGVFSRRFGVPLIDGGTQRLPRLIGLSRALDLILTGRPCSGEEAFAIGLAQRLVEPGRAREAAEGLAEEMAAFPQRCLRSDREAAYRGLELDFDQAMALEFRLGLGVIESGEPLEGARRFRAGEGRHGAAVPPKEG